MKLLLKAAVRTSKHFTLLIATAATLVGLTLATQLEMFTLGILTNQEKKNPLAGVLHKIADYLHVSNASLESILTLLIIVAIFKALALFFSRYFARLFSIRVSQDLRQQYFEHIQQLPMSFYARFNIGSLSTRVAADANQIAQSLNSAVTNYLQAPYAIISTLAGCFYISWRLSLIIFIGVPLVILPIIFVTRKVKKITRQLQKNQERFASVLIDFLGGIQTVKVFAMEKFSLKKYREQNDEMGRLEAKTAKYDLLTRPILHTITTVCLAVVAIFGLHVLKIGVPSLLVFCGLLHILYEPVKKFAEENANIQKGTVAAERLFEVMNEMPLIEDAHNAIKIKEFKSEIEFQRVWFRYEDAWILKDVSFSVKKGETVALVGATGAGKSTIVQLLPRLYEPQQGDILIDGKSVRAYTQKSLRELIAFVPQKPFLFLDSIASNITVGKEYVDGEIELAAKRAHAIEFIDDLPERFDTQLAEMGKNFSGGQQQRLAIARALIRQAPILILDEATSSLDAISETRIKEAIEELHGQVTQVIIAHRLSTIEHADKIVFLEDGIKLAEGTKEELIESCVPFRLMWEAYTATHTTRKTPTPV
ncbi:MAG: Lipid A export ATP-binding/permease protein MsbA [Chlamydiia bacterium]|nr:Lipid A export ATP-binding/permease protein MsbA [Chlamydiia bacterium]MCH9615885.1 Lipid A export ATP-binding/permease protein MsbA [Chlamydiia bacterium]MCH9628712.1 Lipid A export ATP-binding/permease protein MsbA [Chlamydiia bacterium]